MKRCRKKDILSLIDIRMGANDSVAKALSADADQLTDVFIQCQGTAVKIIRKTARL